jgi:beta-glucosidase
LGLVADGLVTRSASMSRRDACCVKFVLGLFENPFVDAEAADRIVGSAAFRAAGDAAQRASITVLQSSPALPFARGVRLYVEGIAAGVAAGYGEVVATPEEADLAVLRLEAPYEERIDVRELLPRRFSRVPGGDHRACS